MKIGDEVYFDFKPAVVSALDDDGHVFSVAYSHCTTSGHLQEDVYPAEPGIAEISDYFYIRYVWIQKRNMINPRVYAYFVKHWHQAVKAYKEEDIKELENQKTIINDFVDELTSLPDVIVHGVTIHAFNN